MTLPHLPLPRVGRQDLLDPARASDEVLVVVFLRGGADGLTLVPPVADDDYHRARPMLGVQRDAAIDLDGYFALHRTLEPLHHRFASGGLSVIHGAGSEDGTRSHFEAQDTMEHGGTMAGSGWLARFLRAGGVRSSARSSALSAVAIGTTRPESLRGAPRSAVMQTVQDFGFGDRDASLVEQLAQLYAIEAGPLGRAAEATIDAVQKLRALRANSEAPDGGATYPASEFGRGLREIARLIKADVGLSATTIDLNGWDTHFVQRTAIDGLMRDLAGGLDALLTDLGPHARRTTVVVMTEFGRRLRENTSFGTDHGAGSAMLLLGESVTDAGLGGRVISSWPDLSAGNLDDVGDVPAALNYRDVLAPLLMRHTPDVDLASVFPGHAVRPLGEKPTTDASLSVAPDCLHGPVPGATDSEASVSSALDPTG